MSKALYHLLCCNLSSSSTTTTTTISFICMTITKYYSIAKATWNYSLILPWNRETIEFIIFLDCLIWRQIYGILAIQRAFHLQGDASLALAWVLDDSYNIIFLRVSLINGFQGNNLQLTWAIAYFQVTVFQQAWTSSRHDIHEPYRAAISVSWVNTEFNTRDNKTRSLCIFSPYEMQ